MARTRRCIVLLASLACGAAGCVKPPVPGDGGAAVGRVSPRNDRVAPPSSATAPHAPSARGHVAERDARCLSIDARCAFEDVDKAFRAQRFVRLSPDEVRLVSHWLEAAGAAGGVWDATCELHARGELCKVEVVGLDAEGLAAAVARRPTFRATSLELRRWADLREGEAPDDLGFADDRAAIVLEAGAPSHATTPDGHSWVFVELAHPTRVAGGVASPPSTASTPPRAPPPAVGRSPALVQSTLTCAFPPGAVDDHAQVPVTVTVDRAGLVKSATVLHDPGQGFGRSAKSCLLSASFVPGTDASGTPTEATATVTVRFSR